MRNTANGIVQFEYGDDGRDPVAMEGSSGQALDLDRMLSHTRATTSAHIPADPLDEDAVRCLLCSFVLNMESLADWSCCMWTCIADHPQCTASNVA